MDITTILTAGLEFLKKTTLVYLAVFLSVAFIFFIPPDMQVYLGLDELLSKDHKGWASGVGILSFFLWLTSLWPVVHGVYAQHKQKKEVKRVSTQIINTYKALPTESRVILGVCVKFDLKRINAALTDPGVQEIMDTGWVWRNMETFNFYNLEWNNLKKFRRDIRDDFELLTGNNTPEIKEKVSSVLEILNKRNTRL